jgi:hypothetical protein
MIDPRAVAVQGIGYVAIVVATAGLLFEEAPAVSSGGGSYRFIEPYAKPKKKEEQQDASVWLQPIKLKASIGKPSALGAIRIDAECRLYANSLASDVGEVMTSSTKNLHDEEFAILLAMV